MKRPTKGHQEEEFTRERTIDPEDEKRIETEKLLQQRFKTFDLYCKEMNHLLEAWDRTQGNIFRQPSPSEKSEHEDQLAATKKKAKDLKGKRLITLFVMSGK